MWPRSTALALLSLAALAAPAAAKELWEYDWIELRTPHFVIASALSEKKTRELGTELEEFRYLLGQFSTIKRFDERIPTKIYLLPRAEKDLGFDGKLDAYFLPGMRANYAAVLPAGSFTDEGLKHEYIHFLVRNQGRLQYPPWFDEGFAEFFSTLRVKGTRVELGKPSSNRVEWLVNNPIWLSYQRVLNVREPHELGIDQGAMFYAQSWLLVHYLMLANGEFGKRNLEFLRRCEGGEPVSPAFQAAFGIEVGSLATRLQRYMGKLPYYNGPAEHLPEFETKTRPIAREEIGAALGALALLTRSPAAARSYYEAALAANPSYGPALTGIGDIDKFAGRFDEAKPYYEKAIALEPNEESHELDYAEYFLDLARVRAQRDGGHTSDSTRADLGEARKHFARAYNPEVLALNGATYLFAGEDATKGVESLEAALALVPSQEQIRGLLAQAYIAAGEREKARKQLEILLAWAHPESVEPIQKLLDLLNAEPPAPSPPQADAGGSSGQN
jgi:tetratricopeptide (TPR) repeat protein